MLSNTMQICTILLTSNFTLPFSLNKTFVPKRCKTFHKHLKPYPYFHIMDGMYYTVHLLTPPLVGELDGALWTLQWPCRPHSSKHAAKKTPCPARQARQGVPTPYGSQRRGCPPKSNPHTAKTTNETGTFGHQLQMKLVTYLGNNQLTYPIWKYTPISKIK